MIKCHMLGTSFPDIDELVFLLTDSEGSQASYSDVC